jgi:hypothetical protein
MRRTSFGVRERPVYYGCSAFLGGEGVQTGGEPILELRGMVYGPNGLERLCLLYESRGRDWDFHSMRWEQHSDGAWKAKVTITREKFQSNHAAPRWVSELFSLDPQCGWGVVKVAESDPPENDRAIGCRYSWRTWDFLNNREVGKLKDCESPHDEL